MNLHNQFRLTHSNDLAKDHDQFQEVFTEFRLQVVLDSAISLSLELVRPYSSRFSWSFRLFFGSPSPTCPDLRVINHDMNVWKCEIKTQEQAWYYKCMIAVIFQLYLGELFFGTFVCPVTTLAALLKNYSLPNYTFDIIAAGD